MIRTVLPSISRSMVGRFNNFDKPFIGHRRDRAASLEAQQHMCSLFCSPTRSGSVAFAFVDKPHVSLASYYGRQLNTSL